MIKKTFNKLLLNGKNNSKVYKLLYHQQFYIIGLSLSFFTLKYSFKNKLGSMTKSNSNQGNNVNSNEDEEKKAEEIFKDPFWRSRAKLKTDNSK